MHNPTKSHDYYWLVIWKQFRKHKLGMTALYVVVLFCLVAIYAPFLASSKPLVVKYEGVWYFPLFRYLFYTGFFTKRLDIFFNLLIFAFPLMLLSLWLFKRHSRISLFIFFVILAAQCGLFVYFIYRTPKDPASDPQLNIKRYEALKSNPLPSWDFDLKYMNPYAKLNLILRHQQRWRQQQRLQRFSKSFEEKEGKNKSTPVTMPTLWQIAHNHEVDQIKRFNAILNESPKNSPAYIRAKAQLDYIIDRQRWLEEQSAKLSNEVFPLLRPFHWEDDAGGSQALNRYINWWELTRINRKDLVAALIFGVRISLTVGLMAVVLALVIGVPIGSFAGYYGGNIDIFVSRLLEIWESMPTFFMLLMVVAITQSKSIFLVIAVIGIFGWTSFSRYIRGEFFKQRNLSYVEACRALGFRDRFIMFSHILPNAIPPLLTLLPFAVMSAITSEAGLSFLGLGEEGSCSWGVLMDEGRTAFPAESYLMWPPAILLTTLLVAIALVGDAFRDALDPKMHL
jgi:peptide/nickel transport system permease protein